MLVFANLSTEDLPKNEPMSPIKRLTHSKWAQVLILLIGTMFTAMSSLETPLLNTGVRFKDWVAATVITASASRWCGFLFRRQQAGQIGLKILSSCRWDVLQTWLKFGNSSPAVRPCCSSCVVKKATRVELVHIIFDSLHRSKKGGGTTLLGQLENLIKTDFFRQTGQSAVGAFVRRPMSSQSSVPATIARKHSGYYEISSSTGRRRFTFQSSLVRKRALFEAKHDN